MTKLHQFAKRLRKNSTDTERFLWSRLRSKRLDGLKFRRQEPVGPYIVDFICYEKNIVIECDGSQHIDDYERDQIRDRYLNEKGLRVLRFWDSEVLQNKEGVMEEIWRVVKEPSPSSPP